MYYKFIKDHFKKDFLGANPQARGTPWTPCSLGSQVGVLGRPISDPNGLPDGVSAMGWRVKTLLGGHVWAMIWKANDSEKNTYPKLLQKVLKFNWPSLKLYNTAPENWRLEDEISFWDCLYSGLMLLSERVIVLYRLVSGKDWWTFVGKYLLALHFKLTSHAAWLMIRLIRPTTNQGPLQDLQHFFHQVVVIKNSLRWGWKLWCGEENLTRDPGREIPGMTAWPNGVKKEAVMFKSFGELLTMDSSTKIRVK